MAWTNIPDDVLEPGKPIRSVDAIALRDNPIAIAQGLPGAPRVTDAALSGTATNTGRDWVLNRTALAQVGAVGTYAFLLLTEGAASPLNASVAAGSTRAGSSLRYANAAGTIIGSGGSHSTFGGSGSLDTATFNVSGTPSGTWRLMGFVQDYIATANERQFTGSLWLRIS